MWDATLACLSSWKFNQLPALAAIAAMLEARGAIDAPSESAPSQQPVLASPSTRCQCSAASQRLNSAKQPAKFDPRFLKICVSVCLCIHPHKFDSPGVKTCSDLHFCRSVNLYRKIYKKSCLNGVQFHASGHLIVICRATQFSPYGKQVGSHRLPPK